MARCDAALWRRPTKSVIVATVTSLIAVGCAGQQGLLGRFSASQDPYQAWSCEQLSQEIARTDPGLGKAEKNAIEQVMAAKNCIRPLAAETE